MRKLVTALFLGLVFYGICSLFYTQEVKYWLPTPVPADYKEIPMGTLVKFEDIKEGSRKFLHFYNPNCPCSKFNLKTYKDLIRDYKDEFECYAVVQNTLEGVDSDDIDYLKKLGVKLIIDENEKLAKKLGVYSTPQIVLLDEDNTIYYRGNYNQSRYCTNNTTFFAKVAIDSMINGKNYIFPNTAFTAYGCVLERDTH